MENALYVGGFEMEQKTAMKISMVSIVGNILLSLFKALAGIVANSGAMIATNEELMIARDTMHIVLSRI